MNIVTRRPFGPVGIFKDFNNFGNSQIAVSNKRTETVSRPAVDILETEQNYTLAVDLPGIKPENIDVTTEDGVISIRASRVVEQQADNTENDSGGQDEQPATVTVKRIERFHGEYLRQFNMPEDANLSSVAAKCEHGVLELTVPKAEKQQPQRITIN